MKTLVWIAVAACGLCLNAQNKVPRMPDGKPDFSGVWDHPRVLDITQDSGPDCSSALKFKGCKQVGSGPLSFTPAGAEIFKNHEAATEKFDPGVFCMPWGYFRSWNTPSPAEFVQRADRLVVLFEQSSTFHIIFLDGRPHPKDFSTWFGHSVGHWEGDTLVVDTTGFNGKTWIDTAEHPHSDALHMVERFTRTSFDTITYDVTLEDPKIYTKPIKNSRILKLLPPGEELLEYYCEENNIELFKAVNK
jgi:hypothetical protein